jgi:hypothetical protein
VPPLARMPATLRVHCSRHSCSVRISSSSTVLQPPDSISITVTNFLHRVCQLGVSCICPCMLHICVALPQGPSCLIVLGSVTRDVVRHAGFRLRFGQGMTRCQCTSSPWKILADRTTSPCYHSTPLALWHGRDPNSTITRHPRKSSGCLRSPNLLHLEPTSWMADMLYLAMWWKCALLAPHCALCLLPPAHVFASCTAYRHSKQKPQLCWHCVQGQSDLLEMKVGDKINYIKVVDGQDNLVMPKA